MKINSKFIVIFNLLIFFLFLLPSGKLDLFEENYSTLSLNARGYFFLLFLGISCGSIMAYETSFISGKRNALLLFVGLLMGTVVPHHVPYDLQGNLHLIFAYTGFFLLILVTYINSLYNTDPICRNILILMIAAVAMMYMRYMMVNTVSEIIIMMICMGINLFLYLKRL